MAPVSKREKLLQTAIKLFIKNGFHAVTVDAISEEAGITKRTLYYHFKSKEELILAALRYRDERFRNDFMRAVEGRTEDPVARLLVAFDVLEEWFREDDFYGCLFVTALGEYPEENTSIRSFCQEAKGLTQKYIAGLAKDAELNNAEQIAEQLVLLIEGAITMAQVNNSPLCAAQAKKAAKILIENSQFNPVPA
ncbi:MAG: TetR/AcrR family transcriptional regulator [Nitrospinota bacterium]